MNIKLTANLIEHGAILSNKLHGFSLGWYNSQYININGIPLPRKKGKAIITREEAIELINEALWSEETRIIIKMLDVNVILDVDMDQTGEDE